MPFEMQMSFWTALRRGVKSSEMNEGDSNVSMQIKKSSNALLCNTDFPHFPGRGFCRSCQHSAQWSCKWYCQCCCHTALPIRCCVMQVFMISGSLMNQLILLCCFSMHKSLTLRFDSKMNQETPEYSGWHQTSPAKFFGLESKLIVLACSIKAYHGDQPILSTLIAADCPSCNLSSFLPCSSHVEHPPLAHTVIATVSS